MNKRIEQIHQRRELLVIQADLQRFGLALQIEPWKKSLSKIDRVLAFTRGLRDTRTLFTIAVSAALAVVSRNRVGRAVQLGWSAWNTYRKLRKA